MISGTGSTLCASNRSGHWCRVKTGDLTDSDYAWRRLASDNVKSRPAGNILSQRPCAQCEPPRPDLPGRFPREKPNAGTDSGLHHLTGRLRGRGRRARVLRLNPQQRPHHLRRRTGMRRGKALVAQTPPGDQGIHATRYGRPHGQRRSRHRRPAQNRPALAAGFSGAARSRAPCGTASRGFVRRRVR